MHVSDPQSNQLLHRPLKLAFFDIDGTLLGLDGNYTARVANAIARVQALGIKTAVASGRPKFAADFLIRELGLSAAGCFCTGAHLEDPKTGQLIARHSLSPELVSRLICAASDRGVYTELCFGDEFFVDHRPEVSRLHSQHLRSTPKQVDCLRKQVDHGPVIKMLFAVTREEEHRQLHQLERDFPEAVFAYAKMAAKPEWLFVSVISDQGCKRRGFQQLLDFHQVESEQTIAFGDAQSDKIFLELAGVGVAMGNAADDVKAVANLRTLPVWDDGVAIVLERYAEIHS
ncbi:MAG: HAD hydrolase family protein [Cellvibrionaceae bacterium]